MRGHSGFVGEVLLLLASCAKLTWHWYPDPGTLYSGEILSIFSRGHDILRVSFTPFQLTGPRENRTASRKEKGFPDKLFKVSRYLEVHEKLKSPTHAIGTKKKEKEKKRASYHDILLSENHCFIV